MRLGGRSVWRSRAALFALLGLLLLANVVVLVSHSVFYEARLHGLQKDQTELQTQRDEARAAAQKAAASQQRLAAMQKDLERFYSETLGDRRERLAPLIEEIYGITRKAGFVPGGFGFAENEVPSARRLTITFEVQGRYADIKRLLAAFESNPGFLMLETVTVAVDQTAPDSLKVGLTVAHYFRSEGDASSIPARRRVRESR